MLENLPLSSRLPLLLPLACALTLLIGCPPAPDGTDAGQQDAGQQDAGRQDAGQQDAGPQDAGPQDAGRQDAGRQDAGQHDAGQQDAGQQDAGRQDAGQQDDAGLQDAGHDAGPVAVECSFNSDCQADERCECDAVEGCFCREGARGTGMNGIDTCESGDDCASALCLEGPDGPDGDFYCSAECASEADCTGALPVCSNIAFVGQVCIREPPTDP